MQETAVRVLLAQTYWWRGKAFKLYANTETMT